MILAVYFIATVLCCELFALGFWLAHQTTKEEPWNESASTRA